LKKATVVTAFMIMLLAITFTFTTLLPHATAIYGVEITSITPETYSGKVGETIRIIGTINTTNGEYRIWFGDYDVTPSGSRAIGNQANATFQIPHVPNGNYTIKLQDVDKNINATTSTLFHVEPAYYIKAGNVPSSPQQLQENSTVNILVNVTGGKQNTIYYANVSIMIPSPLRTNYSATVGLTNTTDTGDGLANIAYPNQTLFQPFGSHTNYTGIYWVYFNKTQNLAEDSFFVGITDKSEYHREEIVQIKAVGYQSNQTTTITITFPKTNITYPPTTLNASQQGVITTTWQVPSNASIGVYNVTITINSGVPIKPIRDSQLFNVPGYPIQVYTRNLAGDIVPQILVEVLDVATDMRYSNISETNGLVGFRLEKGNHTFEAFWRGKVKVGEMPNITITGDQTYNFTCELTNMKITVEDKDGNLMPFVPLKINYTYITKEDKKENASITGQTGLYGLFFINSTLSHVNYTIDASRYGIIFNKNNNTIQDLPAKAWFNVTILCPPKTLTLNITENHRNPLPNARVELIEQMGGISYTKTSNESGIAVINCTFGNYTLKVYVDNIFLNETFVEIFNDTYSEIYCKLYNLTVSVKVVDYFGQPISNAKVTWQLYGRQDSALTKFDGLATFSNIIGGDLQVTVYLPEQSQPFIVTTSFVDGSKTIEIKLDKYVMLAGFLVETSYLTTVIIIAVAVLLVLLIEVYRKKRLKPSKSSS
jgi:hypothetical protein